MLTSGADQTRMAVRAKDAMPGADPACAVRDELKRVLESRVFFRSERLSRFLAFVVEESLEGGARPVKEYVIATEVYDRPSSFDPQIDPIVRMEARRLRKKLHEYYGGEGRTHAVEIALPLGGYVPVFRWRTGEREGHPGSVSPQLKFVILVPFAARDAKETTREFSRALSDEVARELFGDGLSVRIADGCCAARDCASEQRPTAMLQGDVGRNGEELRVSARLTDTIDDTVIWSQIYARKVSDESAAHHRIATAIASAILRAAGEYAVAS